jgi:hypothetical protein
VRLENYNPNREDQTFENVAMSRLLDGALVLKDNTVQRLRSVIGRGWQGARPINEETAKRYARNPPSVRTGISRPVYKRAYSKGKYHYTGQPWTAREFGQMLRSVRVVRKLTPSGKALSTKRNIRVYVGNFLVYYPAILEFYNPFFRPALSASMSGIKHAIGAS